MEKGLLFRLDDITPGLNKENFNRIEKIFDAFDVKPMIGVVPCNEDEHLIVDEEFRPVTDEEGKPVSDKEGKLVSDKKQEEFWDNIKRLQDKGWTIALHGYKHVYVNEQKGLLEANPFSEFAGVDYEEQVDIISKGKDILESYGLKVGYFMAPGHTFDENTLKALAVNGISRITDGYTDKPYIREGITFVPCTLTEPKVPEGIDTVCIHLNNWKDTEFEALEAFLKTNVGLVTGFEKVEDEVQPIEYGTETATREKKYIRLRDRKQKAAESEVMQYYLQKSYSTNKYVKLIKRVLMLPFLLRSKGAAANIIRAVLFVAIFLWMLVGLSYVLRTNGDTKDRMAGFYAEDKDSIDVLMFGASTVGTSFCSPYMWEKYGFTSYPLSSNSQRTTSIRYLIDEGMKYQNPDMIVIEMRTFYGDDEEMALDEGHIRETTDNMRYSVNRIKAINGIADHYEDKWPFYFDIMKYHSNYGMLAEANEWKKITFKTKDKYKGFCIRNEIKSYWQKRHDDSTDGVSRTPLAQKQEEVLRDLLDYLKEENIEALFVVSPRDFDANYCAVMNYAGDIVREAGYDYLDMNLSYDDMEFSFATDMNDGAHTNVWGALKCSDLLGQYIMQNYELNADHSEKVKKEWDRAYNDFMDDYNNTVPVMTD